MATCDKGTIVGKERWISYLNDEIDEAFPDMDDSYSPDLGTNGRIAVWMTPNLRVMKSLQRGVKKKRKQQSRCKGRMAARRRERVCGIL